MKTDLVALLFYMNLVHTPSILNYIKAIKYPVEVLKKRIFSVIFIFFYDSVSFYPNKLGRMIKWTKNLESVFNLTIVLN
jgi:hypothetical protein